MRRSELPGERVMEVLDPPHGMGPIQGSLTPLHSPLFLCYVGLACTLVTRTKRGTRTHAVTM
jgi:hypothetical protein